MNLATMQIGATIPKSVGTGISTNSTNGQEDRSFTKTLNAAKIKEILPNQQKKMNDENSTGKFQLNLGLGALLESSQMRPDVAEVDIYSLLNASNLSELGIEISELDLAMGQISLEQLTQILNIDMENLIKTFSELSDEEVTGTILWDILQKLDDSAFTFMQNLATSLEGKGNVSKVMATDVVKILKFVELAASKTDLTLQQELQTSQVKNWLATVASRVTETAQTQQDAKTMLNTTLTGTLTNTKEVSSAVKVIQPSANENIVNTKSTTTELAGNAVAKIVPQTTTVTISLPQTTPASQAENFVKQFEQIMNRSQLANNAQSQRLLIKLYPEHLGSVRIEFSQQNGVMSARILTSTAAGKQMIESQLHQLKTGLVNQNIQLDRIDISQALSEPSRGEQRNQQFNQQSSMNQQNANDQKENRQDEDGLTFEELLAELEV